MRFTKKIIYKGIEIYREGLSSINRENTVLFSLFLSQHVLLGCFKTLLQEYLEISWTAIKKEDA
jgi:hypothetical protein